MTISPSSFDFGRVMAGWWWLLNRDAVRISRFASFWVLATFGLYSLDHALGLNQGLGLFSTTLLLDPFFISVFFLVALNDDGVRPMQVIGDASRHYPAVLALTVLSSIGIFVGILLLILPGLALAVFWALAVPVLLVEKKGPTDALRASYDYVRRHFWPVTGAYIVFCIGYLSVIFLLFAFGLSSDDGAPGPMLAIESLIDIIGAVIGAYLTAAIYRELAYTGRHEVDVFN
ncbi:MAG: YciC family protein [Pseudomonadota bacterium]